MTQDCVVLSPDPYPLAYHTIRRISAPEDTDSGRTIYSGHVPATSVLELPDNDNVREYLMDAPGRKKKTPTDVIKAIRNTLRETPQNFSVLNGGITVVARDVEIDEKQKVAYLTSASIINGSQTQGELKAYLARCEAAKLDAYPVHVKFEIVQTTDDDLIAQISIARNLMNNVSDISIVGRLGVLNELYDAFHKATGGGKLTKSETDLSPDHTRTEKLLQVIAALRPAALSDIRGEGDIPNKAYTYSAKARCLKEFQSIYAGAKAGDQHQEDLYKFYLDICGQAWELYSKWKTHNGFKGCGLRCIERDDRGNIRDVPDGMVFPILAALSAFAVKVNGKWAIRPPATFSDDKLISAAKQIIQKNADSNPQTMGKSEGCYVSLYIMTSVFVGD
jgi:hypothetical protein